MSLLNPNVEKSELQVKNIWIDEERIHVGLMDGRIVSTCPTEKLKNIGLTKLRPKDWVQMK